jgi:hypothetical protein
MMLMGKAHKLQLNVPVSMVGNRWRNKRAAASQRYTDHVHKNRRLLSFLFSLRVTGLLRLAGVALLSSRAVSARGACVACRTGRCCFAPGKRRSFIRSRSRSLTC